MHPEPFKGASIPHDHQQYHTSSCLLPYRRGIRVSDTLLLSRAFLTSPFRLGQYVWPAFVVWGTDRVLRAVRIVIFNFGNFIRKGAAELDAHVDVISPRFLRIRLQRPTHLRWAPGQSVYLTLPSVSTFPLEAHPFTISTVHSAPDMDEDTLVIDEKDSNSSPPSSLARSQEASRMKQLVFFVRVRNGFSQRLLQAAGDDKTFAAFLDGPYSSPPLLKGFETVILIAGGSGVAFTLPLLLDLI